MRGIKLFVLFVISLNIVFYLKAQVPFYPDSPSVKDFDCKGVHCGKVVGWVLDYKTKSPVGEQFGIIIADCSFNDILFGGKATRGAAVTDDRGYFSFRLPEGDYCLVFIPVSKDSKYCGDPLPGCNPEQRQSIKVRRRQITEVNKIAKLGGSIRLKFIDLNGNNVNLKETFPENAKITFNLRSEKVVKIYNYDFKIKETSGNIIEKAAYNLYPETYEGIVHFKYRFYSISPNKGYGSQKIDSIAVVGGETIEVIVVVDMEHHKTGIEGKITDINGAPLKNVAIKIVSYSEFSTNEIIQFCIRGECSSDENGYYKILGLTELDHPYRIRVYFRHEDGSSSGKWIENINIIKNKIIKKNIVFDINEKI